MRAFAIAFILIVIGYSCYGQNSAEFDRCVDGAKPQSVLNECASEEAMLADSELKTTSDGFLAKIAGDSRAIAKFKEAERIWRLYREAYIEAVFPAQDKQIAYGTEYPMDVNLLRAKLTREHLGAITYLVSEYQPTQ